MAGILHCTDLKSACNCLSSLPTAGKWINATCLSIASGVTPESRNCNCDHECDGLCIGNSCQGFCH